MPARKFRCRKSNSCISWGKLEPLWPECWSYFCCSGGDLFFRANLAPLHRLQAEPATSGSRQGECGDEAPVHQGGPGLLSSIPFCNVLGSSPEETFICAWGKPHSSPAQPNLGRLGCPLSKDLQAELHVLAVCSMRQ